jgi:hypothetical protein
MLRKKIATDLQLEKERFKLLRRSEIVNTGIDCGDKQCVLEHHLMQNCIVYLPANNTECQIPCKLSGCKQEVHHFISCPTWMCLPHTTTTSTPTTSTTTTSSTTSTSSKSTTTTSRTTTTTSTSSTSTLETTTTTTRPTTTSQLTTTITSSTQSTTQIPPTSTTDILIYSSFALNICLILILIFLLWKFLCKTNQVPMQQPRNPVELNPIIRQRLPNNDHLFTLDSDDDESRPLLQPSAPILCTSSHQHSRQSSLSAVSARSTTGWSWCNITITPPVSASRHRNANEFEQEVAIAQNNFFHMRTFKPVDVRSRIDNTQNQETTV